MRELNLYQHKNCITQHTVADTNKECNNIEIQKNWQKQSIIWSSSCKMSLDERLVNSLAVVVRNKTTTAKVLFTSKTLPKTLKPN